MKVRFKKLRPDAVMPKKAHKTDAGFDLVVISRKVDDYGNITYGTGIAVEVPRGHAGFLYPRSSISKKNLLMVNSVGIIDCGFTGEITAKFSPRSEIGVAFGVYNNIGAKKHPDVFEKGERAVQLIILPIPEIEFVEVEELRESERGSGGYGSTGK